MDKLGRVVEALEKVYSVVHQNVKVWGTLALCECIFLGSRMSQHLAPRPRSLHRFWHVLAAEVDTTMCTLWPLAL